MNARFALLPAVPALLAAPLAGCAQPGDFPSLLPRPIERVEAAPEAPVPSPAPPADARLAAQLAELVARASDGHTAFERQLPAATRAIGAADGAKTESWIIGQQALSRLQAARTPTMTALAELDALAGRLSRSGETSAADLAAVTAASQQVEAIAALQSAEINRLNALLTPS